MKQGALSRGVSVLSLAAFFWTITLTAAPGLHQRIHCGQNNTDHSCAVTFVGAGSYLHSAAKASPDVPHLATEFAPSIALTPCWVPSPFLCGAVFEHAPPAFS